ncbi:SRPBCC family protein [Algiphilus sp.]|uniref:SRPBCC family protein n=1 Tax=Algiphilus sp. TaxID=1872431 RepID=UPI003C3E2029
MQRPETLGALRAHFRETVAAPKARVFAFLADHDRFGTLFAPPFAAQPGALIRRTETAPGDDPNGVGSKRAIRIGGLTLLEEVIITYEPDTLIEYIATRGPIRNHLGRIELGDAAGGGTSLDYRIWADGKLPGVGALVGAQLRAAWKGGWARAANQLSAG